MLLFFNVSSYSDGYASGGDLDLASDCDTDLENQTKLLQFGFEFSLPRPDATNVCLLDSDSDLGDDELYDFSEVLSPPSLDEERSQQSTSEESIGECSPIHHASVPFVQCDWSADTNASQEKAASSSLGMELSPNGPSFSEVEPHKPLDLIY